MSSICQRGCQPCAGLATVASSRAGCMHAVQVKGKVLEAATASRQRASVNLALAAKLQEATH